MIRSWLLILVFFLAQNVSGQVSRLLKEKIKFHVSNIAPKARENVNFRKAYDFYLEEDYDSTIVYSRRYLQQKDKSRSLASFCLFFLGNSFVNKGLYKEAAAEFSKIPRSFPMYPSITFQQANLYLIDGAYKKALKLFLELREDEQFQKFALSESKIEHNIGICYLHLENYDASEIHLIKALELQLSEKDTTLIVGTYMDIANLYYTQFRDDEAIPYFQKAYDLSLKTKDYVLRQSSALNMAVVEENRKDFEKSTAYRKEYDRWKDSVNDQQKVWEIAQVEKRYIAQEKQREIHLLEIENRIKSKERNVILLGAGLLLIVLVLLIYFYRQKIKTNHLILTQKENLDQLNAFKNRLFSIVSHDLRSSVHGLRVSAEKLRLKTSEHQDAELRALIAAQGAIANSTFGLLDNLLNWALLQSDQIYFHSERVALAKIIDQVTINFQPLMDQKEISLAIEIPAGTKVMADVDSLKIVLRNVLDNAIKFSPSGAGLTIWANLDEEHCHLFIKDEGPGMNKEQLAMVKEQSAKVSKENESKEIGTGLGVRLCQSFMQKNGGTFNIASKEGQGTTIELILKTQ